MSEGYKASLAELRDCLGSRLQFVDLPAEKRTCENENQQEGSQAKRGQLRSVLLFA